MATAGELCTTIISDLGRSDVSLSDIVLIDIQSAIRDYEAQRFFFNERLISLTLSVTDTYALSLWATAGSVSDIIEVDSMTVTIGTNRSYELEESGYHELVGSLNNGANGNPDEYAVFNQSIVVYPKPTAAITGTIAAHVKFAAIAAGGFSTSNVWTNDASELIRNAALKRLWGRKFRNLEAAQGAEYAEQQALAALKRRTEGLGGNRVEAYL